jgi:hypothetical protein
LIKKTSAKDPPHSLILLGKTSGDGYVLTVWNTYFAAPTVNFFKNMTGKGTITKFRRKKQFNPETLKIHKQRVYHEIMFLGGGGREGGGGGGVGGVGPPALTTLSF